MLSEFSVLIIQFGFSINNEHQELSPKGQSRSPQKRAAGHPSFGGARTHWAIPSLGSRTFLPSGQQRHIPRQELRQEMPGKGVLKPPNKSINPLGGIPWATMASRPWS